MSVPKQPTAKTPEGRSQPVFKPRVTVATVVEDKGRFLLVEELIGGKPVFNQPAGHLDPDETLIEAARRETMEETGCEVEPYALVGVYQMNVRGRHFVRFAFAARLIAHYPERSLDDGILRAVWLDRDEIGKSHRLRSAMVLRSIDDYRAGRRVALDLLAHL